MLSVSCRWQKEEDGWVSNPGGNRERGTSLQGKKGKLLSGIRCCQETGFVLSWIVHSWES